MRSFRAANGLSSQRDTDALLREVLRKRSERIRSTGERNGSQQPAASFRSPRATALRKHRSIRDASASLLFGAAASQTTGPGHQPGSRHPLPTAGSNQPLTVPVTWQRCHARPPFRLQARRHWHTRMPGESSGFASNTRIGGSHSSRRGAQGSITEHGHQAEALDRRAENFIGRLGSPHSSRSCLSRPPLSRR